METKVCILILLSTFLVNTGSGGKCLAGQKTIQSISDEAVYIGKLEKIGSKDQWLFPQLNVTCSTTITRLRFIGNFINKGNKLPELQFWRRSAPSSSQYDKLHHTNEYASITFESLDRFVTPVSWPVEPGDVFGVYQPDIKKSRYEVVVQKRGGGISYVLKNQRSPLDTFDASGQSSTDYPHPLFNVEAWNMSCISGFLDIQDIIKKTNVKTGTFLNNLSFNENQVRIIPSFQFGCNGTISKVVFAADTTDARGTPPTYPELQLWYTRHNYFWFYNRRSAITLEGASLTSDLNVYEKTLNPPLRFEAGDVIGLYLPDEANSPLKLAFRRRIPATSVPSYSIEQSNMLTFFNANNPGIDLDYDAPLLKIEYVSDCGQPTPPAHGTVSTVSTTAGSLASYRCGDGYTIVGGSQRTCRESDGVWTSTIPLCQAVDCGQLPSPEHGRVTFASTTAGSVATYHCDSGYKLVGEKETVCNMSTGEWTSALLSCQLVDCLIPSIPKNGQVFYSNQSQGTTFGSVVTYSCDVGFEINGTATRQCTASGDWSGNTPTCTGIKCGLPTVPLNGYAGLINMIPGTELNKRAIYGCSEGYTLIGPNVRICGADKTWNGSAPLCGILQEISLTTITELPPDKSKGTECTYTKYSSESTFKTLTAVTETTDFSTPISRSSSSNQVAVVLVISVLSLVVVFMVVAILAVYKRKRKGKREPVSSRNMMAAVVDLQDNSVDNPIYGGEHPFSFNTWDHLITPDTDQSVLYSNPAPDKCDCPAASSLKLKCVDAEGKKPSLYYDVASIINPLAYEHYEMVDNCAHYEMASDVGFLALPYEIPTTSNQQPTKLDESLPWGTYVPTEEERSASYSNVLPPASTPVLYKSQVLVGSKQVFFEEHDSYWKPASDSASLYEQLARNKYREISREHIMITENLGSGQFGRVDRGLWQSPIGVIPVAIKMLKDRRKRGDKHQVRFLQEAAINGQFQHRNVVKLYGVVTLGRPVMIVLELCANGDLRECLLQSRPLPGEMLAPCWPQRLLNFCKDVACGMEYLSRKSFIHRDLAARNILVTKDKTCKISDFGLSRDLENESYYISHGGKIPVKWTAPEALHYKRYSTASDVWSFGCVMFEIWSLGHKPFEQYTNMETMKLIDRGYRLAPPPGCVKSIYHLMIKCWHPVSSSRPSFSDTLHSLKEMDLEAEASRDFPYLAQKAASIDNVKLGDPLELGLNLHPELQNLYMNGGLC